MLQEKKEERKRRRGREKGILPTIATSTFFTSFSINRFQEIKHKKTQSISIALDLLNWSLSVAELTCE